MNEPDKQDGPLHSLLFFFFAFHVFIDFPTDAEFNLREKKGRPMLSRQTEMKAVVNRKIKNSSVSR